MTTPITMDSTLREVAERLLARGLTLKVGHDALSPGSGRWYAHLWGRSVHAQGRGETAADAIVAAFAEDQSRAEALARAQRGDET